MEDLIEEGDDDSGKFVFPALEEVQRLGDRDLVRPLDLQKFGFNLNPLKLLRLLSTKLEKQILSI